MKVLQSLSSVTLFLIFSSMSALFTFEDAKAQIDEDTMNKSEEDYRWLPVYTIWFA